MRLFYLHGVTLVPGSYRDNVITISNLWLKYFTERSRIVEYKEWLNEATKNIADKPKLPAIIEILGKLTTDVNCAGEFSTAKE